MANVLVDSEDLLVVLKRCAEFELDAKALRSVVNTMRLAAEHPQLWVRFAEAYEDERNNHAKTVMTRYGPLSQAIADGVHVGDALKQLAQWWTPR